VTLPLRKQEVNREYKAVPKVERYSSTRRIDSGRIEDINSK